ncbi:MAG: thiamine pyrophosphate-binding protein [SAR324 cluster bacterium]|nr:thiamine pyrophosphate-binding protein [SAR324 cluster bacterium]
MAKQAKSEAKTMIGGHAVVECIRREGVRHVFNVPGESYLAALDGFFDVPEITLITNRHEGGACYMAEAYGKATRSTGVCFVTRGPGATHASIGVHAASQDSTPLVLLVGQVPRRSRGREAFQEIDYGQFFGSMAKWVVEIDDVRKIPEIVPRAFHVARSGRPGPVVISMPEDVLAEQAAFHFSDPIPAALPHPDPALVQELVERIAAAERPVALVGSGVQYARARQQMVAFCERFQIPVLTSWRRMDAFPNNHPHYVGNLGLGKTPSQDVVREADLVVVIGDRLSDNTTAHYKLFAPGQAIAQVDIDEAVIGRNFAPQLAIISDARLALEAMLEHPASPPKVARAAWMSGHRETFEKFQTPLERPSAAVPMERVLAELRETLPPDAVLTVDAGNASAWVHRYYPYNTEDSFLGPTVGSMGYGLPAAIAAKIAHPDRVVVGTAGDGGFMMTVLELATAVQYKVNIVQLVFNNSGLGTIRMHQEQDYPGRMVGTQLNNPDFAALAESFGARGFKVDAPEAFLPALKEALAADVPVVIEVITDPEVISVSATISELRGGKAAR